MNIHGCHTTISVLFSMKKYVSYRHADIMPEHKELIIIGDFKNRVGKSETIVVGNFEDKVTIKNGNMSVENMNVRWLI